MGGKRLKKEENGGRGGRWESMSCTTTMEAKNHMAHVDVRKGGGYERKNKRGQGRKMNGVKEGLI